MPTDNQSVEGVEQMRRLQAVGKISRGRVMSLADVAGDSPDEHVRILIFSPASSGVSSTDVEASETGLVLFGALGSHLDDDRIAKLRC